MATQFLILKRRQTIVMQKHDKMMRRPQEMMESSETETSYEEEPIDQRKKNKKMQDSIKNKNKVGRNDLLNLPSSEDEKVVVCFSLLSI